MEFANLQGVNFNFNFALSLKFILYKLAIINPFLSTKHYKMSGTLSARFSQLKSADKLVGTGGSGKRSAGRVAVQNEQRSAQRQARRTGSAAVPVNGRAKVGAANGTGQKSGIIKYVELVT